MKDWSDSSRRGSSSMCIVSRSDSLSDSVTHCDSLSDSNCSKIISHSYQMQASKGLQGKKASVRSKPTLAQPAMQLHYQPRKATSALLNREEPAPVQHQHC
eukprot:scaffold54198_cov13-Tisochrysis_lutea.AAC.1